jgi:ribosomal protein S18 acetylase RimI-like enzyme
MRAGSKKHSPKKIRIRPGEPDDLDALVALEREVFGNDCMSRRSLRRFLGSASASVLLVERDGCIVGCAVLLFHPHRVTARLYSIAVAPAMIGHGIGTALLDACERAAQRRSRIEMRLEVHEKNRRAIAHYRKAGYRQFGRHIGYYRDFGDALRFQKSLTTGQTAAKLT